MFEPQLPPELHAIVARALERDPTRRYAHSGVLGYELRRVALTMGVGDGRPFLRSALARAFLAEEEGEGDDVTSELRATTPPPPTPRPSGVSSVDRFARLRGDEPVDAPDGGEPESGRRADDRLESGTLPIAGASDDEEEEGAEEVN
jgi:hypothetical protein